MVLSSALSNFKDKSTYKAAYEHWKEKMMEARKEIDLWDFIEESRAVEETAKQMEKQQKETLYTEDDLKNAFYNGWLYRGDKKYHYQYPKAIWEFLDNLKEK